MLSSHAKAEDGYQDPILLPTVIAFLQQCEATFKNVFGEGLGQWGDPRYAVTVMSLSEPTWCWYLSNDGGRTPKDVRKNKYRSPSTPG